MDHIEFSVSRLRILWGGDWDQPEFLAEVAYLYDQIVRTGTHEPIIDMGMKLIIPFEEVGESCLLLVIDYFRAILQSSLIS
jgi:hypothetical protein